MLNMKTLQILVLFLKGINQTWKAYAHLHLPSSKTSSVTLRFESAYSFQLVYGLIVLETSEDRDL